MLSPDLFRKKSDISVFCKYDPIPSRRNLCNSKIIFCNSDYAEEFLETFGGWIKAQVLIFGNSDRDFSDWTVQIPNSVKRIYLQNSTLIDPMFSVLPIGIENLSIAMNGRPKFFKEKYVNQEKNYCGLAGPLSMTHSERSSFLSDVWMNQQKIYFQKNWLSPHKYAKLSSNYQFILCPRGNGLDTHRFWESLYRGSIPIVSSGRWADSIEALGVPLLQVDEWSPVAVREVIGKSKFSKLVPREIPALWWKYWDLEFGSIIS